MVFICKKVEMLKSLISYVFMVGSSCLVENKMKYYIVTLVFILLISCKEHEKRALKGETEFQKEMNAGFKDASTSPLSKKELKYFKGLDFFPVDDKFKVKAKFIEAPTKTVFKFPTTTNEIVVYEKYGDVFFTIKGEKFKLNIYKSIGSTKEYNDHLFLPFLDKSNGKESYGGGRFVDVLTTDVKPDGTVLIDFNKAYNPYCAYSDKYSCPITPRSNFIDVAIEAGVKRYKQ